SMGLAASAFTAIAFPLLAQPSHAAVAEAGLIVCAISVNNAIMTRASRLGGVLVTGPSALTLIALPWIAIGFGHTLSLQDRGLLEAGALTFLVFSARLAAT